MKVGEILQEIREDYLDDAENPHLWKSATLRRFLSRAQDEAAMRQRLLVDETTAEICEVTLVADQANYVLDPRIVLIEDIRLENVPLAKRTKSQLDRLEPYWWQRTGTVDSYLQRDLTITLIPTPTAAEAGKTLALRVWRMPLTSLASDSDEPEIPAQHHRDLMWFVIAEAFSMPDEDTQDTRKADEYMARFDRVFGPSMRADVLASRRREAKTSFIGPGHAYHGRQAPQMSPARAFDFED